MDGYTWIFSQSSINIFLNGKMWGGICSTTLEGQNPTLPSGACLENLRGDLPDHVLDAIKRECDIRSQSMRAADQLNATSHGVTSSYRQSKADSYEGNIQAM